MKYKIRYETFEVKENPEEYIKTPSNMFNILKKDFSPLQESMTIIGLNIKNGVIYKKTVAMGSYNTIMATPADLFRPLLIAGCGSFILAHNHPSGDTKPSNEDAVLTKKIAKGAEYVGLNFLDHIIYSSDKYYSSKEGGLI